MKNCEFLACWPSGYSLIFQVLKYLQFPSVWTEFWLLRPQAWNLCTPDGSICFTDVLKYSWWNVVACSSSSAYVNVIRRKFIFMPFSLQNEEHLYEIKSILIFELFIHCSKDKPGNLGGKSLCFQLMVCFLLILMKAPTKQTVLAPPKCGFTVNKIIWYSFCHHCITSSAVS